MRRLVGLVGALCIAACAKEPAAAPAGPEPHVPALRGIDGDTFEIDGETIRIANIDAPETGSRARCWAEASLGRLAAKELDSRLGALALVEIKRTGKDRYGRTLATVTTAGVPADLGQAMIEAGFASAWTGRRWDWCAPVTKGAPGAPLLTGDEIGAAEDRSWESQGGQFDDEKAADQQLRDAARDAGFAP